MLKAAFLAASAWRTRPDTSPFPWAGGAGFGLIGETPLVDLSRFSRTHGVRILAKAEFVNPSGSIKDRIAKHIIALAEQRGALKAGSTVVASTSGNTGAAVAMVAAMRGYKVRLWLRGAFSRGPLPTGADSRHLCCVLCVICPVAH